MIKKLLIFSNRKLFSLIEQILVIQCCEMIFVIFLILHQLGVAQQLLQILFGGIVAMVAIAGVIHSILSADLAARGCGSLC